MAFITPKDFRLEVSKGNIQGHTPLNKYGGSHDVDTGTVPEDIWDGSGEFSTLTLYTFSTSDDINKLTSDDNTDTQIIEVQGLDSSYNFVTQNVTLSGQTPVTLTTPLLRAFRMINKGVDMAGNVYLSTSGATFTAGITDDKEDIRAMILVEHEQSLMAIYTVPTGHTLFLDDWYANIKEETGAVSGTFSFRVSPIGQTSFNKKSEFSVHSYSPGNPIPFSYPLRIDEGCDILVRCDLISTNNSGVEAGFNGVLINNI